MSAPKPATPYVPPTSQLVLEIFVRSLPVSLNFYTSLGFTHLSTHGSFATLSWEDHLLFLDERPDLAPLPADYHPAANVRVMVPDVDRWWEKAREVDARVLAPIEDRYYGLRDFTIVDPDGVGVRFGTRL